MAWKSKAAWAYLFKDSEPIAAELWAIMGWEDADITYEVFQVSDSGGVPFQVDDGASGHENFEVRE
jgi:hypothetical protein